MSHAKSALIEESLPSFLDNYENPHTRNAYERSLKTFLRWYEQRAGEKLTWANWTVYETRAWRTDLIQEASPTKQIPRSASTIQAYLAVLRAFARWAVEEGYLSSNPTARVKGIHLERRSVKALTHVQQAALMRAIAQGNPFHRIIITVLLHTGLRASELTNLRLHQVTLGEQKLPLSRGIPKEKQIRVGTVTVIGKRNRERSIPLNATARAALIEWMELRNTTSDSHLFISPETHQPISAKNLNYICSKYQQIVPGLHPHMLRDTFGTRLQEQGVAIEIISNLLGHDKIETTAMYYLTNEARSEFVEWIAEEE